MFSGSALVCSALLTGSLILSARPLSAETLNTDPQQQVLKQQQPVVETPATSEGGSVGTALTNEFAQKDFVVAPVSYVATAYSLRGRTASGLPVSKGVIAADPRVLPLGSRVRLEAGAYSGEYLVADTGGAVRGRRIDIWTPTSREAMRFGRRLIKLTVLSFGGKRRSQHAVR